MNWSHCLWASLLSVVAFGSTVAQESVEIELNLYSARHYQTDEALYEGFTKQTGIRINRVEGTDDELLQRIQNEGGNGPADVLLMVDVARLATGHEMGLFAPVQSAVLEARIPSHLRTRDWFALSIRARVIIYNKTVLKAGDVRRYDDLADPRLKGKVCSRSSSHPYNLSLIASIIAHQGEARAEQWAKGVVANLVRTPGGGDTDQIRAVANGECAVALVNTYYLARLLRSDKAEDRLLMAHVGVAWPDQQGVGTHINVSGGAVLKNAPHREAAIRFLEYLVGDRAQRYFADGNNEWPVVAGVKVTNPALESLGRFKADTIPISSLAMYRAKAKVLLDRVGFR